ncbi:YeeE/YedE family protein [Rhodobacterales bacterium HKCCE4037]|nr:YeeE/YedE family protein [Rhodobacterales bacterium HKCCE4037]
MAAVMETLSERLGDGALLMLAGALIGLLFGAAAQRSRFCLRAATVELARGQMGPRIAIWFLAFATALFATQVMVLAGWLDLANARQLSGVGSLSGAVIGGLMFGIGMILARGCASRLLVLSATGNLRALVTGLILTVTAQAALTGFLASPREQLSALLVISGESRDGMALLGLTQPTIVAVAAVALVASLWFARSRKVLWSHVISGIGVGAAVALAWLATYRISQVSFDIVPVASITFTGPSADTLMAFVGARSLPMSFGLGLVPGVFAGSALSAVISREWRIERFGPDTPMERYILGAVLMGFGSMLAGGCAVGSAMAGGSVLALTSWVAGMSIWAGGILTTWMMDRVAVSQPTAAA